jgi:S-(hydroxymethyl)glutathione synthase
MAQPSIHPAIDAGLTKGAPNFAGGTLYCKCATDKVAVAITGDVLHNHACGCSKCWKPEGALFSVVGVVPVANLKVTAHPEKLAIVDPAATIQRHACKACGVHMYGRIEKEHPFKGLDFVHTELSSEKGWQEPQFSAFCSSIIEQGFDPSGMDAIRAKFKSVGIATYDCLSPALMDAIAAYTAEKAGTAFKETAAKAPAKAGTSIHPLIDNGLTKGQPNFAGGTLYCKCPSDKVAVAVTGDVAHNHACGCSKCWKPDGALFSVVGVVPVANIKVTAHPEKLAIVDPSATIQRHACKACGTHMYGRIEKEHPFKGLDFVHAELSDKTGWQEPQFAAFCSSIIEQGFDPSGMDAIRGKFKSVGLATYDCLSPALMDAIASYTAGKAGTAYKEPVAAKPAPTPAPPPPKKGFFARLFGG